MCVMREDVRSVSGIYFLLADATELINEYGKFGILDSKSRIVREALYDTAYPIDENLIYVSQNNRYGLLQNNGIEIIPCEYNELFCEKCCIIATDETGVYLLVLKEERLSLDPWMVYCP